jgi:hypothetical protein
MKNLGHPLRGAAPEGGFLLEFRPTDYQPHFPQ